MLLKPQPQLHTPGAIQAHGVLIALDGRGVVTHLSVNAANLLGDEAPSLGHALPEPFGLSGASLAAEADGGEDSALADHHRVALNGRQFDCLVRRQKWGTLVELEPSPHPRQDLDPGPTLHQVVRHLRQQTNVQGLLDEGTRALRAMLGFDRVLAYHFKRDGSSQVVAEASSATDWPPRLGQRFPEAHIPVEARRLFSLNPARHVPDADSAPVPLEAAPGHDAPLDMTLSALRSVPDFHSHYLHDSGISASMCVPLIVDGDLWGILACHHRAAVQVPYPVRASCAVLGELLSTQLQYQLAKDRAARELTHERLRGNLLAQLQGATDPALVLASRLPNMARAFEAQAAVLSHQSSVFAHGDIPHGLQTALLRWLHDGGVDSGRVYVTDALTESAPDLAAQLTGWGGMMSFCLTNPARRGSCFCAARPRTPATAMCPAQRVAPLVKPRPAQTATLTALSHGAPWSGMRCRHWATAWGCWWALAWPTCTATATPSGPCCARRRVKWRCPSPATKPVASTACCTRRWSRASCAATSSHWPWHPWTCPPCCPRA